MSVLPQRALKLISEYSKPLTRSDWKNGSRHAIIFKNILMNTTAIDYLIYEDCTTIIDMINKYGEISLYNFWSPYADFDSPICFYDLLKIKKYLKIDNTLFKVFYIYDSEWHLINFELEFGIDWNIYETEKEKIIKYGWNNFKSMNVNL